MAEFLPRLQPVASGVLPRAPFDHRWFGTAAGLDIVVISKRPVQSFSEHLVSDRLGHWVAYQHHVPTGARRRIGSSARGQARLGKAFGLR